MIFQVSQGPAYVHFFVKVLHDSKLKSVRAGLFRSQPVEKHSGRPTTATRWYRELFPSGSEKDDIIVGSHINRSTSIDV